mgnify:CR=1 FL=1
MNKSVTFSFAKVSDLEQICLIEGQNYKFPWSKKSFEEEIKISDSGKGFFLVLKIGKEIIGYVCCRKIIDEANIINISIKKEFQNRGYGRKLLNYLLKNVEKENIKNIYLEVRESNSIAQKLYQKLGFRKFALRKNFYPDNENAVVMYLNLDRKDEKDENKI